MKTIMSKMKNILDRIGSRSELAMKKKRKKRKEREKNKVCEYITTEAT